jgi:dimethylargininase
MHAIVREVSASMARCELTYLERAPIDLPLARQQHAGYVAALAAAGADVISLPADDSLPDSVFVEDTAVVLDTIAVMALPGARSRWPEVPPMRAALERFRATVSIETPATLDGGDVLRVGRTLFVGRSKRTNDEGIRQLREIARRDGYEVVPVALNGVLHLKSAVTALTDRLVLLNRAWLDPAPFSAFEQLDVAAGEPSAANTLTLGGVVHMSARFPNTRALVEAAGFRTVPLDMSEMEKAEGAVTCCSVIVA